VSEQAPIERKNDEKCFVYHSISLYKNPMQKHSSFSHFIELL